MRRLYRVKFDGGAHRRISLARTDLALVCILAFLFYAKSAGMGWFAAIAICFWIIGYFANDIF